MNRLRCLWQRLQWWLIDGAKDDNLSDGALLAYDDIHA